MVGTIHIEKLPEGIYLATSEDVQGLVAPGRTIAKTLEIARELVKKLLEVQSNATKRIQKLGDHFDHPLVMSI